MGRGVVGRGAMGRGAIGRGAMGRGAMGRGAVGRGAVGRGVIEWDVGQGSYWATDSRSNCAAIGEGNLIDRFRSRHPENGSSVNSWVRPSDLSPAHLDSDCQALVAAAKFPLDVALVIFLSHVDRGLVARRVGRGAGELAACYCLDILGARNRDGIRASRCSISCCWRSL